MQSHSSLVSASTASFPQPSLEPSTATLSKTFRTRTAGALLLMLTATSAVCYLLPWPSDATNYFADDIAAISFAVALTVLIGGALSTGAFSAKRVSSVIGVIAAVALAVIAGAQILVSMLWNGPTDMVDGVLPAASLLSFWVASLCILLDGCWRGPARYLPFLTASWPVTVLAVGLIVGELGDAAWVAFVIHTLLGLCLTSLALIIDAPRIGSSRRSPTRERASYRRPPR